MKVKILRFCKLFAISVLLYVYPLSHISAQQTNTYSGNGIYSIGTCGDINNPQAKELACVVNNAITMGLEIVGAIIIIVIIFAGIRYLTSMGNPDRVAGAKKTLVGGIIGLIIVIVSAFLINIVVNLISGI